MLAWVMNLGFAAGDAGGAAPVSREDQGRPTRVWVTDVVRRID